MPKSVPTFPVSQSKIDKLTKAMDEAREYQESYWYLSQEHLLLGAFFF